MWLQEAKATNWEKRFVIFSRFPTIKSYPPHFCLVFAIYDTSHAAPHTSWKLKTMPLLTFRTLQHISYLPPTAQDSRPKTGKHYKCQVGKKTFCKITNNKNVITVNSNQRYQNKHRKSKLMLLLLWWFENDECYTLRSRQAATLT